MKIIFRAFIILFFLFIVQLIASCCKCDDPVTTPYSNKSCTLFNLDNSGITPITSNALSIVKTAYGIRVKLSIEKIACREFIPSLFFEPACAFDCRCLDKIFIPKDSLVSLKILTKNDFDLSKPAGSDISDYFKVYEPYKYSSIAQFLKNRTNTFYDIMDTTSQVDLLLMTPPALGTSHQFEVEVGLSDGRILKDQTNPVNLN